MNHMTETMKIEDFDQATALWRSTEGVGLNESDSRENTAIFLKRNPDMSFIARNPNAEIIGAVLCGQDGRRAYIYHLAVREDYRGRGIGKGLVESCLSKLAKLGLHKCNILVYSDNVAGKAFWRHAGWEERSDLRLMQTLTRR